MGDKNAQTADACNITYKHLTGDTERVMPDLLLITKNYPQEKNIPLKENTKDKWVAWYPPNCCHIQILQRRNTIQMLFTWK